MARPPAYHLYCEDLPTMRAGNDLQALTEMAKLHSSIFGKRYLVKDFNGNVVWEDAEDATT